MKTDFLEVGWKTFKKYIKQDLTSEQEEDLKMMFYAGAFACFQTMVNIIAMSKGVEGPTDKDEELMECLSNEMKEYFEKQKDQKIPVFRKSGKSKDSVKFTNQENPRLRKDLGPGIFRRF